MDWCNEELKTVKISPPLHRRLKLEALKADMNLTQYVEMLLERSLLDALADQKQ